MDKDMSKKYYITVLFRNSFFGYSYKKIPLF